MDNTSPAERLELADANFVAHASWAHERCPRMRVLNTQHCVIADSGLSCDTFNIICRARFTDQNALSQASKAIEHFQLVHRPFSWWLGPADQPAGLGSILVQAGLVQAETELAMSADLRDLPELPALPNFDIRPVRSAAELNVFAQTLAPGDEWVERFYQQVAGVILSDLSPQRFFLGYDQEIPVATAELTIAGGVAGIYNISTLADYRRRGYGTAITAHALHQARQLGYQISVLQASADGARIYQRLGFSPAGQITEYKPPPV